MMGSARRIYPGELAFYGRGRLTLGKVVFLLSLLLILVGWAMMADFLSGHPPSRLMSLGVKAGVIRQIRA